MCVLLIKYFRRGVDLLATILGIFKFKLKGNDHGFFYKRRPHENAENYFNGDTGE